MVTLLFCIIGLLIVMLSYACHSPKLSKLAQKAKVFPKVNSAQLYLSHGLHFLKMQLSLIIII